MLRYSPIQLDHGRDFLGNESKFCGKSGVRVEWRYEVRETNFVRRLKTLDQLEKRKIFDSMELGCIISGAVFAP